MSKFLSTFAAVALGAVLLLVQLGGIGAQTPHVGSATVLSVVQSQNPTEQGNFTVSMQLSNTTDISLVFFTFCQLSRSVCYQPIVMHPQGSNWYVGTTDAMSSYNGMKSGILAGYNITIQYTDNSTMTLPRLPNPFTNLTVATTVAGWYMYQMMVRNQVYGLTGVVQDSATGVGIPGANVTLTSANGTTPTTTSSTGTFSMAGLPNGTYTLEVTKTGYKANSVTVAIAGKDLVQDVALTNATIPPDHGASKPAGTSWGFFGSPTGLGVAGVIGALVILVVAWVALSRSRKQKGARRPPPSDTAEGSPPTPVPPP